MFVSETWLQPSIPNSIFDIPGYGLFRDDNLDCLGYRGVCIYVSSHISSSFGVDVIHHNWTGIDNLFLKITKPCFSLLVGCIYRPRPSSADWSCAQFMRQSSLDYNNMLITGDFNCPDITWPIVQLPSVNSPSFPYAEIVSNSALQQLVENPTRYRLGQNPSTLDLFFTSDPDTVSEIKYLAPFGKSDHLTLATEIQLQAPTSQNNQFKTIRKVNYDGIAAELSSKNWSLILADDQMNAIWSTFLSIVETAIASNTYTKQVKFNPLRPWIDDRILALVRRKKSLWQRFLRTRADSDYINHRNLSNFVSKEIKSSKAAFENNLVSSRNPKRMFKYVRSFLNSKVGAPIVRRLDGNMCGSPVESADVLADVFSSAFTSEPPGPIPTCQTERSIPGMSHVWIDEETVEKYLLELKVDTSPGRDGITSRLLKYCAKAMAVPLSTIFSKSFRDSCLPCDWLSATVTPIFKKGDKLSPLNYRPISLVSSVAKVLERIICDQLIKFAMEHSIIPREQHGFIPGRSTLTNLLTGLSAWTESYDRGIPVDVLYLDFSKAFDRVPHRRLISKLDHLGVRGNLLSWISAFLSNRTFRVKVGDALSSSNRTVGSGVPQGSVLGPILFLLYTSDLPCILKSPCLLFADDTKLYNNPLSSYSTLQEDLDRLVQWCSDWLLPLNVDKCSVLHIGKTNPSFHYRLDGKTLPSVLHQCDLGVTVTTDLSWSKHIAHITSKAKQTAFILSKSFNGCNNATLSKLIKYYVRPILEYAGPAWWPSSRADAALLESVQRWVTRFPYGPIRPSYEERLQLFSLPNFEDRRTRGDIIFTFKALRNHFGDDIRRLFSRNHNHLRGHSLKLRREQFRTPQRQQFLTNRVFHLWNSLPSDLVDATSTNAFKNGYDRWITQPRE